MDLLKICLLSFVASAFATNYCTVPTCGTSQIACNNNGSFSSSCIQPQIIPMSQTYINLILNGHNYYRNLTAGGGVVNLNPAVRMAKMTWSNELANMSQFFVNQCNPQLEDCHNTPTFKLSGQNSENFVSNFPITPSYLIQLSIDTWFSPSAETTNNDIANLTYPSENNADIYSFTEMVNDHNVAVGCAFIQNKILVNNMSYFSYMFACDYATACFIGKPVFISGPTASQCTTHDTTYISLCGVNENIDWNYYFDGYI